MKVLRALPALCVLWSSSHAQQFNCNLPGSTNPSQPTVTPTLPTFPNTFQTRIEATIQDKAYTVSAEEYFDNNNNRASLSMLKNGQIFKLIFDYTNDQLFYVLPGGLCKVTNLTTDNNNVLFGNVLLPGGGGLHVFTSAGALQFIQNNNQYMGQVSVRGILCDWWKSNASWPQLNSVFTLNYYFSAQSWMTPAGFTDQGGNQVIPVRAEICGVANKTYSFHHVYDYADFQPFLDPMTTVFETPAGVVCPGRVQTRSVPQLKNALIYREEIISPSSVAVTQADVWYDQNYKLVRYDFRPYTAQYPFYNTDAATEIHDFNTGVAYAIDRTMANCTVIPIQNASFDSSINVNQSLNRQEFVLTMKSPGQLFYLDSNYTFEGQRYARGLLCDVFISQRTDFMMNGIGFNATFEFYFLANGQTAQNNNGNADSADSAVPIQLRINVPTIPYSATYNFYNFDQEDAEITGFDVSTCFSQEQQIGFKLTFYGTFDAPVRAYKTIFLLNTISAVAAAAGVSPLRIAKADFYFQPDQAFFVASLLDKAPVLQRYRKLPGKVVQYNNDAVINNIMDVQDCASLCISNPNFTCNSFEYCPTSSICTLSKIHTADGNVQVSTQQCDLYDRTLGGNAYQEVSLQQAWQNLRNSVIKRLVKTSVAFDKNTQTYTASDVSNDIVSTDTNSPSSTSLLQSYKAMVNRYVPNFDDMILTGMSIDDCAQACNSQETFVCNSFEYQYGTNECYLSHLHPDEQPDKIKSATGVDLYIRDYTTRFTETAGTTVLSSSNVIYQGIYDTNNCARLCVDYNEFNCKSFDFCPDIGTCFLGKTHVFDAPKSQIKADPMCNHWSRNYIDDFSYTRRSYIRMTNDRVISGINVQQCAKLCVDEETFSCASFDYCGNYTECRLTTASLKNVGQVTLETNLYCDVYTRQSFPDGTAYIANPQKYYGTTKPQSTGISKGAAGGLAFGMIILGVVLTILGIFIYFKLTGKGVDDMRIQFTKQVDEE